MKRTIEIPEGVKCPDCGGTNLVGSGRNEWRVNRAWKPGSEFPKRNQYQRFKCCDCGRIFIDKEKGIISDNGKVKR